jgi:hypothetical protein
MKDALKFSGTISSVKVELKTDVSETCRLHNQGRSPKTMIFNSTLPFHAFISTDLCKKIEISDEILRESYENEGR